MAAVDESRGWNCLHWAAAGAHVNVFIFLLRKFPRLNVRDAQQLSPIDIFHWAIGAFLDGVVIVCCGVVSNSMMTGIFFLSSKVQMSEKLEEMDEASTLKRGNFSSLANHSV